MFRAILFDFGDTLAYLWVPKADRFAWLCGQSGIRIGPSLVRTGAIAFERVWNEETTSPSLGWRGNVDAYAAGLAAAGVTDFRGLAGQMFDTAKILPSELHADPDAHELLGALKHQGLALGVISNHYGALEEQLRGLGLDAYWDVMLDSGKLGVQKPAPRIFRLACERLGIPPEEAVYVGDEPRADAGGAIAAGIRSVLIDPLDAYGVGYCGLN